MVQTVVINETPGELSLKEGNAGVYRDIKKLPPKGHHIIDIDPNATYREYVVVSSPNGEKVFVTSDDCIDNSVIKISVEAGVYKFSGKPRGDAATDVEGGPSGFISRILKRIWPGKK